MNHLGPPSRNDPDPLDIVGASDRLLEGGRCSPSGSRRG